MMKNHYWAILMLILIGCSPNPTVGPAMVTPLPSLTPVVESTATKTTVTATATQTAMPTFTPIITTIPYRPIATPSAKESSMNRASQ
jgi:hypothetical protein